MAKYEDITIGQIAELTHQITQSDLRKFVELSGDDNPLHTDSAYAAKTAFKKPVAHGMLGVSFISTVIGTKLPGDGALWFAQNLEFLLPVRVGDVITVRVEVMKKDDRARVIEMQTDIINQNRQKVTQGYAKVKIVEQEKALDLIEKSSKASVARVALVIGGSGGIGSAVSLALANHGFDVAVHYFKNAEAAHGVSEGIQSIGRRSYVCNCDIADPIAVNAMVENVLKRLGSITVLVNCSTTKIAAIKFNDLQWNDFELHLNNQIRGAFNLAQAVVPQMSAQKYGKLISINSQAFETPSADWLPYIAAKGALTGFNRALAFDLAPKGIRVNSVAPGMTDTDQISDIPERVRMVTAAKTPLRRLANPEDVANAVLFLASDQSDFLCGETIRVNGGQVMI